MTKPDPYMTAILDIRDTLEDVSGKLGYVRGKLDAVCIAQRAHEGRLLALEATHRANDVKVMADSIVEQKPMPTHTPTPMVSTPGIPTGWATMDTSTRIIIIVSAITATLITIAGIIAPLLGWL